MGDIYSNVYPNLSISTGRTRSSSKEDWGKAFAVVVEVFYLQELFIQLKHGAANFAEECSEASKLFLTNDLLNIWWNMGCTSSYMYCITSSSQGYDNMICRWHDKQTVLGLSRPFRWLYHILLNLLDHLDFFISTNILLDLETSKDHFSSGAPDCYPPEWEKVYDNPLVL